MGKKKARMGRPPKPPEEKQGQCVMVRMTKVERAKLEREAGKAGLSLSAYLLECWREKRR